MQARGSSCRSRSDDGRDLAQASGRQLVTSRSLFTSYLDQLSNFALESMAVFNRPPSRRGFAHKSSSIPSRILNSKLVALWHLSIWSRVQLPVGLATLWAFSIWALHQAGLVRVGGGAGSITGILAMVTGGLAFGPSLRGKLIPCFYQVCSSASEADLRTIGEHSALEVGTVTLVRSAPLTLVFASWYEGRRTWSSIQATSRNTFRQFLFANASQIPPLANSPAAANLHEFCMLLCGFSIATVHHLRDEFGVSYSDLRSILPTSLLSTCENAPTIGAVAGRQAGPTPGQGGVPRNLPLVIIRTMHVALNEMKATAAIDAGTWSTGQAALNQLSDHLTALERIRDTPIPMVLQIQ